MILVQKNFRFANGQPAANHDIDVFIRDTITRPDLFNDSIGLEPVPNPVTTDLIGNVDFYIDTGFYDFGAMGIRVPFDAVEGTGGGTPPYLHIQSTPASTWIIDHNRGFSKDPTVIVDSRPDVSVIVDIEHGTLNQTTISFPSPETGKAFF